MLFKEEGAFSRKVFFEGRGLAFLKEGACFFGVSGRVKFPVGLDPQYKPWILSLLKNLHQNQA